MDPREFPDDEQFAQWARRYGTTGVKNVELSMSPNHGCIAVYREMSMNERQLLARMEEIDDEHPGAFDHQRMVVANCLLHPTLDAYPHPAFAAAELFPRIRQHGHGQMEEGEEMVTVDKEKGTIPRHMVRDIRNARKAAFEAFHSPTISSIYKDLIIEMASGPNGEIDPQTLDYLWKQSPGRIRDLAARIEQAHADIRREALQYLQEGAADMDAEEKQARAQHVEETFASPFVAIDTVVGKEATPGDDEEIDEVQQEPQQHDDSLPPNRPTSKEEVKEILRQANQGHA